MAETKKYIDIANPATIRAIHYFLCKNSFFPLQGCREVDVHFHKKYVVMAPFVLSMLAAWADQCDKSNIELTCRIDRQEDIRVLNYAWRMGLTEFMNIDYKPQRYAEHEPTGKIIPLRQIATSNELENFLVDVTPLLHWSGYAKHAGAIRYCFSELIRNVLEHSGIAPNAYVCAQYYKKSKKISIGIADCGKGILSSLQKNYPDLNDDTSAIIAAMKPGVTGGNPKENAGAGLYFIRSIAKVSGTYFAVYSGSACYRLRERTKDSPGTLFADPLKERHDLYRDLPYWRGTVIAVEIGLRNPLAFDELLDQIRKTFYESRFKSRKKRRVRFT